ncbi:hypothetical protein DFJ73DRAFT_871215 [Zopfochytrium polystomum]|nr:hypothetical protein DFJ73DRAFT_871215 [Zopfochytrium polystomum]
MADPSTTLAATAAGSHDQHKRRLAIVTGASKGFGRAVALAILHDHAARAAAAALDIVLVGGADSRALDESVALCRAAAASTGLKHLTLTPLLADFATTPPTAPVAAVLAAIPHPPSAYASSLLVNNAGTLGPLAHCRTHADADIVHNAAVNLAAPLSLTAAFLNAFARSFPSPPAASPAVVVVNVSSLAAVKPFEAWGLYAATKAARDMYFRTVAVEEAANGVGVLNYAPGPMDTEMQRRIRDEMPDGDVKEAYREMHEKGNLVDPNDSARVLVRLIAEGLHMDGEHVDFFDFKQ